MENNEIDLNKAKLDPALVFTSPEDVQNHPSLSRSLKVEILRRWAYDASELEVAEEEGMAGGESSQLDRILHALDSLTGGYDVAHSPPTKQQGVWV